MITAKELKDFLENVPNEWLDYQIVVNLGMNVMRNPILTTLRKNPTTYTGDKIIIFDKGKYWEGNK